MVHTILRSLAALKNVPVAELDPLYDRLEPDALVSLMAHAKDAESTVNVEFTIDEFTVVVTHDTVYVHTGEPIVATIGDRR
ncbi:HalOD1 output domain-containing protein [Natronoglomus mannanivorans]|uniref:Halobacterial output domain-containing protein n=1 Tax=Natronoglomus mannanivorans TaxID=2979990 RepID=A0AAP3E4U1_9EURY|nr:hypothetical protein [Halobacteria archaeon AArc-xg1-1]